MPLQGFLFGASKCLGPRQIPDLVWSIAMGESAERSHATHPKGERGAAHPIMHGPRIGFSSPLRPSGAERKRSAPRLASKGFETRRAAALAWLTWKSWKMIFSLEHRTPKKQTKNSKQRLKQIAMASNLLAMASNLIAMASNLEAFSFYSPNY